MACFRYLAILAGATFASCASNTPAGRPHAMSAASHEREADRQAQAEEDHDARFRARQAIERERCAPGRPLPKTGDSLGEGVCWTSVHNPTAAHLGDAAEHRRQAADHRAASEALRAAEASACAGLAPDDRDASPFQHPEDIASVAPLSLSEFDARGKLPAERNIGAVVTFRAVPGLSAEWLQRLVDCHLARNVALGHVVPEMSDCPFVPAGVEARVSSAGNGFAVAVSSQDPKVAREILSRADRLRASTTRPR